MAASIFLSPTMAKILISSLWFLYQKGIFIFLYAIRRKVDILGLTSFPGGITFGVI